MRIKWFYLLVVPTLVFVYISFQVTKSLVPASYSSSLTKKSERLLAIPEQQTGGWRGPRGGKIILMTYGRSGSSFTSEIIQRHPEVFYTFEPLFTLMRRFKKMDSKETEKQTLWNVESVDIIEAFLTCQFESLDVQDMNNNQLRNAKDSRLLWRCVRKSANFTAAEAIDCFIKAKDACLKKPIHMVKTIRMTGETALTLMEKHRDLQILYLIRDPRGTITSQNRVFHNFKWNAVGNFSTSYCDNMKQDLHAVGRMLTTYGPDRIKILRYERLAENPISVSEEVYKFLGLNFTTAIRQFVFKKTQAGQGGGNAFSTNKGNSTIAAYSWRRNVTLAAAQTIDSNCKEVYETAGYIPVRSQEELVDMDRKLWTARDYDGGGEV